MDERRYMQKFTPRRAGSRWSSTNVAAVKRLVAEGRMREVGLRTLPPDLLRDGAEADLAAQETARRKAELPPEMVDVIRADDESRRVWDGLPPSHRARYAGWILDAKRPETRHRRLEEAVGMLRKGMRELMK